METCYLEGGTNSCGALLFVKQLTNVPSLPPHSQVESCRSKSRQHSDSDSIPVLPVSEELYLFWGDKLWVSQLCLWSESPPDSWVLCRERGERKVAVRALSTEAGS